MIASAIRQKVLVIDDELGPRESLRILLKNEYEVFCANSVMAGMELLRERDPDVVVMDIRMPGKSGIEGLREIRALDKDIAVIILTGFGALETAQEAMRLGASDYLKKPFDTREMMDVIRHNVQRTAFNRKRAGAERELQELNARLTVELEKKDRLASLGHASAELVHDLRNPLTVILGYVQILGEDLAQARATQNGTGEGGSEYVELIEQNVQRCREIVETWQDLGRDTKRSFAKISPADLLREIVDSQRPLFAARHAAIQLSLDDLDSEINGDRVQLGRALRNIVGNAVDALPPAAGQVFVTGGVRGDKYCVWVKDNGCGISAEDAGKMFDAYYSTKAPRKGTGLGLFITKRVIEDHGGTIEVDSVVGKGTEMRVILPLA
ncbi:MAG: hybrid sensor histidine kinase/response regulator [Kiritimatiellae bacterium]|nr:hybrid sensor histidine kinase/response regulator [Kiritimatiellia bacterium]